MNNTTAISREDESVSTPSNLPLRALAEDYAIATQAFLESPTHGSAADVLALVYGDSVIAERTALDGRAEFYRRSPGRCTYSPFPTIRREARAILERAVSKALKVQEGRTEGQGIRDLYSKAGKAKSKSRTKDFIAGALAFFSDVVLVSPSIPWNATAETIPTETTVLDFSGDELAARDPWPGEYFRNPAPCTAEELLGAEKAPRFEAFLETLFADSETRQSARECFAACLSGKPSKTFQSWTNPEGDGGKNTAFDFLCGLVPGRIVMAKSALILYKGDSSERRFGEIELQGKAGVFFDEVGGAYDVPQIKKLTGLSSIRGEAKGRDSVEFPQTWALVALSNDLPRFSPANDGAFLSRVFVLPFSSVFYVDDAAYQRRLEEGISPLRLKHAADKTALLAGILEERPAILAELSRTWITMRAREGRPYESPECTRAKETYRQANDLAERFFAEYLIRDEGSTVDYPVIKDAWAEFTGETRPSMRDVVTLLTKRYPFISLYRSHGVKKLRGISLKEEVPPTHPYADTLEETGAPGAPNHDFLPREGKTENSSIGVKNACLGHPEHPELPGLKSDPREKDRAYLLSALRTGRLNDLAPDALAEIRNIADGHGEFIETVDFVLSYLRENENMPEGQEVDDVEEETRPTEEEDAKRERDGTPPGPVDSPPSETALQKLGTP